MFSLESPDVNAAVTCIENGGEGGVDQMGDLCCLVLVSAFEFITTVGKGG